MPDAVIVVGQVRSVVPGGTPVLLALGKSDDGGGGGEAGGGAGGGGGEPAPEPPPGCAGEPEPEPGDGCFGDALPPRLLVYAVARVRRVTRLCAETRSKSTA